VRELDEIISLLERLRSEKGCHWDREQTIQSLKRDLKEEYGEVLEAIDSGDTENLKEEIGDLIWVLLLMAQIASEERMFSARDVLKYTRDKIIRRHPHVFGNEKAESAEDALRIFKEAKEREKNGLQKTGKKA
jgi:tetrapyrrole methylase family protein/MazG family protein